MAAICSRWLVALLLLTTLAAAIPSGLSRAQELPADQVADQSDASPSPDVPTETGTATPTATATSTETTTEFATVTATEAATIAPTDPPALTPTETATLEPTATATQTLAAATEPLVDAITITPTAIPSGTPTATATATATPSGTPNNAPVAAATSPTPTTTLTAAPGQPITLADITVAIDCRRNPETITIANIGHRSVYINSIETMYAPIRGEPFVLEERLRPGRTVVLSMGSRATGRVLTKDAIFTNSAYDQDGLILGLSIGTITRRCPAADPAATPRHEPRQTTVSESVALVTTATRLRGAPRSSSPTLIIIPQGATVATTGMAYSRYVSVAYQATRGWILASDIIFDLPAPPAGKPAATTDWVNVRSSPSISGTVLAILSPGTRVTDTGAIQNGYRSVVYQSTSGWIYADYLAIQSPGPEEWIDVNRTSGIVTLYRGTTVVATYQASVSADASSHGFLATAIGTYHVFAKTAPLSYTPYGNSYIRYWVGFDPNRENGFHSWEMDSRGRLLAKASRVTSGCVSTPLTSASAIYAFADIGMRVMIHW